MAVLISPCTVQVQSIRPEAFTEERPSVRGVSPKNSCSSIGVRGKISSGERVPSDPRPLEPNATARASVRTLSGSVKLRSVSVRMVDLLAISLHDLDAETRELSSFIQPVLVHTPSFLTFPCRSIARLCVTVCSAVRCSLPWAS